MSDNKQTRDNYKKSEEEYTKLRDAKTMLDTIYKLKLLPADLQNQLAELYDSVSNEIQVTRRSLAYLEQYVFNKKRKPRSYPIHEQAVLNTYEPGEIWTSEQFAHDDLSRRQQKTDATEVNVAQSRGILR